MRFHMLTAALAVLVAAPALADETYETGLGRIVDTVSMAEGGHLLIEGRAIAGLRSGGAVSAAIYVDGQECARSTTRGEGLTATGASCLIVAEPGRSHVIELHETHSRGISKRSTLLTSTIDDPSAPGTLLGRAQGQYQQVVSVQSDRDLDLSVLGEAQVMLAADEMSPTGTSGVGSVEAHYKTAGEWESCFQKPFNAYTETNHALGCEVKLLAGDRLTVVMEIPTGAGALTDYARLYVAAAGEAQSN